MDRAILAVEKEIARIATVKGLMETIQSNSGKVLDELRKMTQSVERQIGILRETAEALRRQ